MYCKSTKVVNATGLHARPAADFVKVSKKFDSKITVTRENDPKNVKANGKSLISILALCATKDSVIHIAAEGADEVDAVETLAALVDSGLGE